MTAAKDLITSISDLRQLYPMPKERALKKQLDHLDLHCERFIAASPFVVLASHSEAGELDASPRGGEPGFVKIRHSRQLLVPDAPGNNRLDSLMNIVATGKVGMLFFVPGMDETLRVNGSAWVTTDAAILNGFADAKRVPRTVIGIDVAEVYLHCAKAVMRSRLWDPDARIDRASLPSMGEMISDQTGAPLETQEQMLARYAADL